MKTFIVLLALATAVESKAIESRITGGTPAVAGAVPSFAALQIEFERGIRTCGGFLHSNMDRIVTTASCLWDYTDGKANNVKIALGQSNDFTQNIAQWSDAWRLTAYKPALNESENDLAVITLTTTLPAAAGAVTYAPANPNTGADPAVGDVVTICGFGVTDNNRTKPTSLQCASFTVALPALCFTASIAAQINTPAPSALPNTMICLRNSGSDVNACSGDFGAPIWSAKTGTPVPVGVVSFFPNAKPNARCQDGHLVIATALSSFSSTFLQTPTLLTGGLGTNL